MKKILPNDPCPCKSGKKYKFCCKKNEQFVEEIRNVTGGDYIDTGYIFNDISSKSKIMESYLEKMLPLINMTIFFAENHKADADIRSIWTTDKSAGIIILKETPVKEEDYFELAHEIAQFYLVKKNFPTVDADNIENKSLGSILVKTLMDPIINKMLYEDGFDLMGYLQKNFTKQLPVFVAYPEEDKLSIFQRHFIKCLIIQRELEWDIIGENSFKNELNEIYKKKYPVICEEAVRFIENVKAEDLNDFAVVRKLLLQLVNENHMEEHIRVI